MIKLTDTQMNVLASACERPDGVATRPATLNRSAAVKVAAKLIEHSLAQEVRAKLGAPVWRMDEGGKASSLKILKAGRTLVRAAAKSAAPAVASSIALVMPSSVRDAGLPENNGGQAAELSQPKLGSKRTLILALMQREQGATIYDLIGATGWLPHTTRAALTGLRKSGVAIARSRDPQAEASVYRINVPAAAAAA